MVSARSRLIALGLLTSAALAHAQDDGGVPLVPDFPDGRSVVPLESVAVADEGHSLFTNPAGPAFTEPRSIEFYQTFIPSTTHSGPGDVGRGLFWSMPSLRLAWQYTGTDAGPGQGVLAFSQSRLLRPGLAFGSALSFSYFNHTETPLAGLIGVRLGLQGRPHRSVSVGLVIDNLLSPLPTLPDFRTRARVGIGLRPFGDWLTLSADGGAYLATLTDDPEASALFSLGLEPVPGIRIHGSLEGLDLTQNPSWIVGLGATLRFSSTSIGDQGFLRASGSGVAPSADSFYVGVHGQRTPSVLNPASMRGQVWEVRVAGDLLAPPPANFLTPTQPAVPLLHALRRLRAAERVRSVKAVVLTIDNPDSSLAELQELRAAAQRVRSSGRLVVAYLHRADAADLALASACDLIAVHPSGGLDLNPPDKELYYLRGALEKAGIQVEVVRSSAYKSAPEPYTETGPSDEAREMNAWVLESLFAQEVAAVSAGRSLPEARVRELLASGPLSPAEARDAGLIDAILYPDELESLLEQKLGRSYPLTRDDESHQILLTRWGPRAHVGLVYVHGTLRRSSSEILPLITGERVVNAGEVVRALEEMQEDDAIRAVVVRVDSPGGDVFAADEIRRAIEQLREHKPVIISMGRAAASGGYFLSLPGDVILADPATLTGSIGVFSTKVNVAGLLERVSVKSVHFESAPSPDTTSLSRPWTEEERARVEAEVQRTYQDFISRVSRRRGLSPEEVELIAGGRVWTGQQALEHRLIDGIGGLDVAIEQARARGRIAESAPLELEVWPERALTDGLLNRLLSGEISSLLDPLERLRTETRQELDRTQQHPIYAAPLPPEP